MKNQEADIAEILFSRPINVEKVKSKGVREKISAKPEECEKLTSQLNINKLDALNFDCTLMPWKKGGVEVSGVVTATIEEICVVTLEVFTTEIKQDIKRYYERAGRSAPEIPVVDMEKLEDDLPDQFEGGQIDIGDIAVETLALCLSPHPRKPGAVFTDHVESDPDSPDDPARKNPFDVLQQLKKH